MESLRNEPVNLNSGSVPPTILTTGNQGSGYGFGEGLLGLAAVAALFGGGLGGWGANKGGFVDYGTLINQQGQSDIRRDVGETESEIRETLHTQAIGNMGEFRAISDKLGDIDKTATVSQYENQIATKDATASLSNKIDYETNAIKHQNFTMQVSMDKQFADLNHRLEHKFNDLVAREQATEIERLRRELNASATALANQDVIRSVVSQVVAAMTP